MITTEDHVTHSWRSMMVSGAPASLVALLMSFTASAALALPGQAGSYSGTAAGAVTEAKSRPGAGVATKLPHAGAGENWSTPRCPATLKLLSRPTRLGYKETDEYVSEKIRLVWREDDPLDVRIVRPRKAQRPPVVLYLYSFPNTTQRFDDPGYCQRVVAHGCAAVGFESALTGSRVRGVRPMREWFVSELAEALTKSAHDVTMILNYIETRGDLDTGRIGMYGQGSGASIAILTAPVEARIKALDLLNPWADWPVWLRETARVRDDERPPFLKPEFLQRVSGLEPIRVLPSLKSVPVRVSLVPNDASVPVACLDAVQKAAPAGSVVDRYTTTADFIRANSEGRIFAWMSKQLTGPKERTVTVPKQ